MRLLILASFAIVLQACAQEGDNSAETSESTTDTTSTAFGPVINTEGMLLQTRFNPPKGFEREAVDSGSFAHYLRNLPLKEAGSLVKYYDGGSKSNYAYEAVVDLDIGKRNLHQCADAVMRLKAEYLWDSKQYDKIHFNFTNGFRVDYSEWMKGKRMVVKGNKTCWVNGAARANNYQDFWKYMELIFNYAGTLSLDREMKSKPVDQMEIGDVFILGGSPGHAIIVADMVVNPTTGKKKFLLAQSYMPAQETQILKNPLDPMSPWYSTDFGDVLNTPEWTFYANQLKGWE
jgi:hypothetical protein